MLKNLKFKKRHLGVPFFICYSNEITSFLPNAAANFFNVFSEGLAFPFSILLISPCVIPVKSDNSFCVIFLSFLASIISFII